ncbi:hypothetical protein ABH924_000128 [Arthrobacter sp. GAS37]|uniref:hypothetical protein n=1 Tax=Arthrobacter sp. GAS37 TaxID=3156261 RepID=UPI0038348FFD
MSIATDTITATRPSLDDWGVRHGSAAQLAADIRERTGSTDELPRENPHWLGSDDTFGESTALVTDVIREGQHIGFAVQIPYEGLEWIGLEYDGPADDGVFEMVGSRAQIEAAAAYLANAAAALQAFLRA